MRSYWPGITFAIVLSLVGSSTGAISQGRGQYSPDQLRYYCSLGSQTPISVRPYCGGARAPQYLRQDYRAPYADYDDGDNDYGRRSRPLSQQELRYYCSLGGQTPVSARAACVRYGYWR